MISEDAPWSAARDDFRQRQVTSLRTYIRNSPQLPIELWRLDELLTSDAGDADYAPDLIAAFKAASSAPGGAAVLSLYLLLLAREKWESSTSWTIIRSFLNAAHEAGVEQARRMEAVDTSEAYVVAAAADYAPVVVACTQVENALNCSCPVDFSGHARRVVDGATRALEAADNFSNDFAGAASLLRTIAQTDLSYYSLLAEIGDSVRAVVKREASAKVKLERTIAHATAENSQNKYLREDVYGTELRAHVATLSELQAVADGAWLHVDSARLVYCYPFTVLGVEGDFLQRVRALADRGSIGPLVLSDVRTVRLTDMWQEARPGRPHYAAVAVTLPPLVVETTDPVRNTLRLRPEIRFTSLGNHYLRLELSLDDAHPHYVNQALRRPMEVMGYELIRITDDLTCPLLIDYARSIARWLQLALQESVAAECKVLEDFASDVHVVLSIRKLSLREADGRSKPVDGVTALSRDVVGATLLRHPVGQAASSLEEWVRYPSVDAAPDNRSGFRGDVVLRTANSTNIVTPGTPAFLAKSQEEAAEFVAAVPILLASWRSEVARLVGQAQSALRAEPGEWDLEQLQNQRIELSRRVTQIREALTDLHSPLLCRTLTGRRLLNTLWEDAGLAEQEQDLLAQMEFASQIFEQIANALNDVNASKLRRAEKLVTAAVAFVGASSLAGVFSLYDAKYNGAPSVLIIYVQLACVIAVMIAVLALILRRR